eukprot:TRINITY_DN13720_c0_g1_i1.p1 TRINITY_DN13720_c0_g1~~TRINITY_DN13720_c0_g1_i1.p1  ORF type:complete len:518 (-),score=137.85 TRINITY_DN13720_c0_g1_i1:46-1518(-)
MALDQSADRSRSSERIDRTRAQHLFDKYLPQASATVDSVPSKTHQFESSNRLLTVQRALSERELQLLEVKDQYSRSQQELNTIRSDMATLLRHRESELAEKNDQIADLESQLAYARPGEDELMRLRAEVRTLNEENRQITRHLEDRVASREHRLASQDSMLTRQTEIIDLLRSNTMTSKRRVAELEQELTRVREMIHNPDADRLALQAVSVECEQNRRTVQSQKIQLQELQTAYRTLEAGIKESQSLEVIKLQRQLDGYQLLVAQLKAGGSASSPMPQQLSPSPQQPPVAVQRLQQQLTAVSTENAQLQDELDEAQRTIASLRAERSRQQQHQQMAADPMSMSRLLRADEQCQNCASLQDELQLLRARELQLADAQTELLKLQSQLAAQKQSTADAITRADALQAQLDNSLASQERLKIETEGCLRDVQVLVKSVKARTEGFDASVSMLLGDAEDGPPPDVSLVRADVNKLRTQLVELYAESLGSDCITQ